MKSKAAIIDGHNFLFRGFYGVPVQVKRADGTPINAVYGFFSLLRVILKTVNPDYLVIVFDSETSANNKKLAKPEYKANRAPQDNAIFSQLSLIKNCLDILGIYWVEDEHNEADDVIGTYSEKFNKQGAEAYICSNDHDFMQLVCDETFVLRGHRGDVVTYDRSAVVDKFGITPAQYVDYLALAGDPSDNIKGVKGIGKKRAASLLSKYKNIEYMYQSSGSLPLALKKLLGTQEGALLERKEFLKINNRLKLPTALKMKKCLLSKKTIPDKMGEFLTVHWGKII